MAYIGRPNFPFPCPYGSDGTNNLFFNPLQVLYDYDEFLSTENVQSKLLWNSTQSGGSITLGTGVTSGHPGVFQFSSGTTGFSNASINLGKSFILGGGRLVIGFIAQLGQISSSGQNMSPQIGIMDGFGGQVNGNPSNGLYFQYIYSVSPNWQCINSNAGTKSTTTTTIAADTNWHHFVIDINAAASSVNYWIDNTIVATITADIPTVAISPAILVGMNGNGTAGTMNVDWFGYYQFLTTSR